MCSSHSDRFKCVVVILCACVLTGVVLSLSADAELTVSLEQEVTQEDPASVLPIEFTATFSEPVTGFDANDADDADVVFSGDVEVKAYSVTDISAEGRVYSVQVTGARKYGQIVAAIPAGVCVNAGEEPNLASTSADNEVYYAMRRILMLGDSWAWMPWQQRALRGALKDAGLGRFCEEGGRTCIPTQSTAEKWANNYGGFLDTLVEELENYPTIDIVHISLGGNDGLEWRPWWTPDQENTFFTQVAEHLSTVIDFILGQRPDIRVALSGYDYMREGRDGAYPQDVNEMGIRASEIGAAVLEDKGPRFATIHNLGVAQYYLGETFDGTLYGITPDDPYLIPPDYTTYAEPYPPYSVPLPMGPYDDPPCGNFPGGDQRLLSPLPVMLRPPISGDIHFNQLGYSLIAKNCVDQVYGYWLAWPKAYAIEPVGGDQQDAGEIDFKVLFTEPVYGVDHTDFEVHTSLGKEIGDAYVSNVYGNGTDEITVTVDTGAYEGPVWIEMIDNDSIYDIDENPLGGPGEGNGGWAHCGQVAVEEVPVAAWPAALGILALGAVLLGRRGKSYPRYVPGAEKA